MEKQLYTREEFEQLRSDFAKKMAVDESLQKDALDILVRADRFNWIHQTTWFGEPILQLPQDMFSLQEIIYRTRPDYIIEVGVAWAGSLLFYSTLMEALGGKKIIGVDIYIPDDLKARVGSFGKLSERITLIEGSSLEQSTIEKIQAIIGDSKKTLIHLDSNHTHSHVLNELKLYAPLVGKGSYLICGDTIVEKIPEQKHRTRPWGPGNNPKSALDEFLKNNKEFKIDETYQNKYLFSCNPGGYLVRV